MCAEKAKGCPFLLPLCSTSSFSFLTLHRAVSEFGKDFFGSVVLSPLAKHLRAGFSGEDQKGKKDEKQQKKEVSSMS